MLFALVVLGVLFQAPIINTFFAFGEEFGWRAYLLPKLLPLGERRATAVTGMVWGIWHLPIIAMGYNYGLDYPGWPWLGMLLFVWSTFVVGTVIGWLAISGGSVWPAAIAHGMINAVAGLPVLFLSGSPNPLLSPLPVGLTGCAGWTAVALWLLWRWPKPGG